MFFLLIVPFLLLRILIKTIVLLVALPFVLLVVGAGLLVALLAVLCVLIVPLLPFAFIALCAWAIVRSSRPAYSPQP